MFCYQHGVETELSLLLSPLFLAATCAYVKLTTVALIWFPHEGKYRVHAGVFFYVSECFDAGIGPHGISGKLCRIAGASGFKRGFEREWGCAYWGGDYSGEGGCRDCGGAAAGFYRAGEGDD